MRVTIRTEHGRANRTSGWKLRAFAGLIALGLHMDGQAFAGEPSLLALRAHPQRESVGGVSDAQRFAERVKRHQRRHFSKERREFRRLQARLEKQRRMRKARMKARAFAAARRRAERALGGRGIRATGNAATYERRPAIVNPAGKSTGGRPSQQGDP